MNSAGAKAGNANDRIVAAAKLVAAWPDGNEESCGSGASVFGVGYRSGGRGRSTSALIAIEIQSERATPITVSSSTPQRRQTALRTTAHTTQPTPPPPP